MPSAERLYIVYNADAGIVAMLLDAAKKAVGIEDCALCEITHSATGEKRAWKECRREMGVPVVHVHRDEIAEHPELQKALVGVKLPVAAVGVAGGIKILMGPDELAPCNGDVAEFRRRLLDAARRVDLDLGR